MRRCCIPQTMQLDTSKKFNTHSQQLFYVLGSGERDFLDKLDFIQNQAPSTVEISTILGFFFPSLGHRRSVNMADEMVL